MAMKPSKAAASVNSVNNNAMETNHTESQNMAHSTFSASVVGTMGSYMCYEDLALFLLADFSNFPRDVCRSDFDRRTKIRKILRHVLNAAPAEVEKLITENEITPKELLVESDINEEYLSKLLDKTKEVPVTLRQWASVSSLSVAGHAGDLPFVVRILAHLVQNEDLRVQAQEQLKKVQSRITDQTLLLDAAKAAVNMTIGADDLVKEKARKQLEEFQKLEMFQRLITDQSIVEEAINAGFTPTWEQKPSEAEQSSAADQEASIERKVSAENTPVKYADEAEFLTPFLRLIKATINYLIQYPELSKKGNWNEMNKLGEIVGECHKKLFRNKHQIIFDPAIPFIANSPCDFNREPNRGPCIYVDGFTLLNLDGLGIGSGALLYKYERGAVPFSWIGEQEVRPGLASNLGFITPLFKLRSAG